MHSSPVPWFAGRAGDLLIYRVNRRPLGEGTLVPGEVPSDVFDHFFRMLTPGFEVVTGRKHQRVWKVGGIETDWSGRFLTGKLGWQPREDEVVADWSEEEKDWTTLTAEPRQHALLPFGFDGERRLLTILLDGAGTAPETLAKVFEKILRTNEGELAEPTTRWSVEPILDTHEFVDWLKSLDHVRLVSFTAKLPNPEPMDAFSGLHDRLSGSNATHITETIKSNREEGLIGVEDDPDVRQAIAMGQQGFASLRGRGRRNGTATTFNQTEEVARERVSDLPSTWGEMREVIRDFLKDRARRFLDEDEPAS